MPHRGKPWSSGSGSTRRCYGASARDARPAGAAGRRPPGVLTKPVRNRRDQQCADDKVSIRTPTAIVAPTWISSSSGSRVRVAKVPARIKPAPVTTPPVLTRATLCALARAPRRRLLPRPGHQEDVVVDAQGDQEEEREEDQVERDTSGRQLREGEGAEPERCRRRKGPPSRSGTAGGHGGPGRRALVDTGRRLALPH